MKVKFRFAVLALLCLAVCLPAVAQLKYDPGMQPGMSLIDIPETADRLANHENALRDDYYRLGWQYFLFEQNVPMAWSITQGIPSIIVDIDDDFSQVNYEAHWQEADIIYQMSQIFEDYDNPDTPWRLKGSSVGNFIWIANDKFYEFTDVATQPYGEYPLPSKFTSDGGTSLLYGGNGHGYGIFSVALAQRDDVGIVGVAPDCSGIATPVLLYDYTNIDVDPVTPGYQLVDVLSLSVVVSESAGSAALRESIRKGVVIVAAIGNSLQEFGHRSEQFPAVACSAAPQDLEHLYVAPKVSYPAAHAWDIDNGGVVDVTKDIKVIAVASVNPGSVVNPNSPCAYWSDEDPVYPKNHQYSPGKDKFPAASVQDREALREYACVDIVTYGNQVTATYEPGVEPAISDQYGFGRGGNSHAAPQVSGTVALMRSVNKWLSSDGSEPSDKDDVHRRAYNILTFTAQKIVDAGISGMHQYTNYETSPPTYALLPGHSCWDAGKFTDLPSDYPLADVIATQPADFAYSISPHDPLQRAWSKRFGYGLLDSYRAVAHAIIKKAEWQYQTSQILATDANSLNENGNYLVHAGAFRNVNGSAGSVLEHGGTTLPGGPAYANNHGETVINGSSTVLTVPTNTILTIDGIVRQSGPSLGSNKIETQGSGKILMAGYLENVELKGNTEIGDLRIHADLSAGTPKGRLSLGGGSSNVFGSISLEEDGEVKLDNGTMTLEAGGAIHMGGNKDLIVQNGATLLMEYPSRISAESGRKVLIESGGKIVIRRKPSSDDVWQSEILCELEIQSGGELQIDDYAFVRFDGITKQPGATISFDPAKLARVDIDDASVFNNASEFFGTTELSQDLVISSGTSIVKPGASIECNSFDIIIKNGATLQIEFNAAISGDPGSSIEIESGGTLMINGPGSILAQGRYSSTDILVPELRVEGDLVLEDNAIARFNHFFVDQSADFICKPGSHLILNERKSYHCLGRLITDVPDQNADRVTISGATACGSAVDFARLFVGQPKTVFNDPLINLLDIRYTDFRNVVVEAVNVPIEPISNCSFQLNGDKAENKGFLVPALLRVWFNDRLDKILVIQPQGVHVGNVDITGCTFSDSFGDRDENSMREDDQYKIGGVLIVRMLWVNIKSNIFEYLNTSISSDRVMSLDVNSNFFNTCSFGLFDHSSAVNFCQNQLERVQFGSAFQTSRPSSIHENNYNICGRGGLYNLDSPLLNVRQNNFSEFAAAIYAKSGVVSMTKNADPDGKIINGFNNFFFSSDDAVNAEFLTVTEESNGVVTQRENMAYDFQFEQGASTENIFECGYNMMSLYSRFHLFNQSALDDPVNTPIALFNVRNNLWSHPGSPFIRFDANNKVQHDGLPINTEESVTPSCDLKPDDPNIANLLCENTGSAHHGGCDEDEFVNIGEWPHLGSAGVRHLAFAYANARTKMFDTQEAASCRKTKMYDAFQAASLLDVNGGAYGPLKTDYTNVTLSTGATVGEKALAIYLKGQVHEELNETTAAISAYNEILTNYTRADVFLPAKWRVQYIQASTADVDHGDTYEQLMVAYQTQVWNDMRIESGSIPTKRSPAPDGTTEPFIALTGSPAALTMISPNPFNDKTRIRYILAESGHVRLVLTSALGNVIRVLEQGRRSAGAHEIELDAGALPSGSYFCRLEVKGQVFSRQMQLIR